MFAQDRHLVLLEPSLFNDVSFFGQRLVLPRPASVSGTTLTIAGVDLAALGVAAGYVAMLDGVPLEVIARTGATTLAVSRLRSGDGDPVVPPGSGASVAISTFRHQIGAAHEQLMALIGVGSFARPGEPAVSEGQIVNAAGLWRLEALLTLRDLVGTIAERSGGSASPWAGRAEFYARRFDAERQRTFAAIDTDGDGLADEARYFNRFFGVRV